MKILIHSGTHWDREWYKTFRGFGFGLVKVMDDLIDGFEKAYETELDGRTVRPLEIKADTVSVTASKWKTVTIRLEKQ